MAEPQEQPSLPEPRENVDYFVDLYGVIEVDREDETEAIRDALREKTKEYTTDRQVGTAKEFSDRAERMMRLINRARGILLDEDKRRAYNELLDTWEGPISTDGNPVTTLDQAFARRVAGKDIEQVEEVFQGLRDRIAAHPGMGSDEEVARAERRLQRARDRDDTDEEEVRDLREDYEVALLAFDVALAIEENERSQVLGRNISSKGGRHYQVSIGYAAVAADELAEMREVKIRELTAIASGSFATRLAILSGEPALSTDIIPARDIADYALPPYYDDQAAKVRALAEKRQGIMQKRLDNLFIDRPGAEFQTELQDNMFVGIIDNAGTNWFAVGRVPGSEELIPPVDVPESVLDDLMAGNYEAAVTAGFNIVTTKRLDNIDDDALVRGAAKIHIRGFNQSEPEQSAE